MVPPYVFPIIFRKKFSKILMVTHYDFSPKMTKIFYFFTKKVQNFPFFYKNCNFLSIFSLKTSISQKIFVCGEVFLNKIFHQNCQFFPFFNKKFSNLTFFKPKMSHFLVYDQGFLVSVKVSQQCQGFPIWLRPQVQALGLGPYQKNIQLGKRCHCRKTLTYLGNLDRETLTFGKP